MASVMIIIMCLQNAVAEKMEGI